MFQRAAAVAAPGHSGDKQKHYWLGCIGERNDGAVVVAKNLYCNCAKKEVHAEHRVMKKMDKGGVLYVTRVHKAGFPDTLNFAMARPCFSCEFSIRAKKVKKVYYTINNNQFGVWTPQSDYDKIYNL